MLVVLIAIYVIGRIAFIYTMVSVEDCMDLEPALLGESGRYDAVMDSILLVTITSIFLLLALGINTLITSKPRLVDYILGVVNSVFALALIWSWAVVWGFFNPDHFLAPYLAGGKNQFLYLPPIAEYHSHTYTGAPGWEEVAPYTFFNADIKIYARQEVVRTCFPAEFIRKQLHNRWRGGVLPTGEAIDDLPDAALERVETMYIFYDGSGEYLTSEFPWSHTRYEALRTMDEQRDNRLESYSPYETLELVQSTFDWQPIAQIDQRPFTRAEIESFVAETWDREAPLDD